MPEIKMTRDEYDALKEELFSLRGKRSEIRERLARARGHGKFMLNPEFDAAQDALGCVESRIREIESQLGNAGIISRGGTGTGREVVRIGSAIRVMNLKTRECEEFTITSAACCDVTRNMISDRSPMGAALMGCRQGYYVKVRCPDGTTLKYKICSVKS